MPKFTTTTAMSRLRTVPFVFVLLALFSILPGCASWDNKAARESVGAKEFATQKDGVCCWIGYKPIPEEGSKVAQGPAGPPGPPGPSGPSGPAAVVPAPVEKPTGVVTIRDVLFDFDKSNIKPEYEGDLSAVAEMLNNDPSLRLEIQGHTDSKGSDAYNQRLSERRAASVKRYLVERHGIAANRLTTAGFGEKRPVADNTTSDGKDNPEGRALNRRVELHKR